MVDQRVDNIMLPCVTHATILLLSLHATGNYGLIYPLYIFWRVVLREGNFTTSHHSSKFNFPL